MESRQVVEAAQCNCMRLVAIDRSRTVFPCCQRQSPYADDNELDMRYLRRGHVSCNELVRRRWKEMVQGPTNQY